MRQPDLTLPSTRRRMLLALAALPVAASARTPSHDPALDAAFAALERELHGQVGVAAIDGASGRTVGHRLDTRFPMCSTFKAVLAGAVLARAAGTPGLLERKLALPKDGFVAYAPITERHVDGEMTVAELCAAALQYSDNTAANTLLRDVVDGPAGLTRYARTLGDTRFRLDRRETALNSAIPGDARDTTTPLAMAHTLRKLLLQDGLPPAGRDQLRDWMLGNTTGGERIRAAVPAGRRVADKTGTGDYGSANDIGVVYPPDGAPDRAPVVLAIYTRREKKDAEPRSDIIARAAKLALDALART